MAPQTIAVLALHPTGNEQGGWFYLSLSTGRKINRLHATELPMLDLVINRVHWMARRNKLGIEFKNRNNEVITDNVIDDDNNSSYQPSHSDSGNSNSDDNSEETSTTSSESTNDDNDLDNDQHRNNQFADNGPIDNSAVDVTKENPD